MVIILLHIVFAISGVHLASADCAVSDNNILRQRNILCSSLGGIPGCKQVKAEGDWPNQVIYMNNLLSALAKAPPCLNTSVAKETVAWLNVTDPKKSSWWYTWVVFQVQYYDMPHKEGARVETAATLGRKCWAFAYLKDTWVKMKPTLQFAMKKAGLDMDAFFNAYDAAIPLTMGLCEKVAANCFVNQTYDPGLRNGTCPDAVGQFYIGFQWENGNNNVQLRNDNLSFPFPRYTQTDRWRDSVTFAVNTALNFII